MGPQSMNWVVIFSKSRKSIDGHISKLNFVAALFIVLAYELTLFADYVLFEFVDNFLHVVFKECLKGLYLLLYKTISLEVTVDDVPTVLRVDLLFRIELYFGSNWGRLVNKMLCH